MEPIEDIKELEPFFTLHGQKYLKVTTIKKPGGRPVNAAMHPGGYLAYFPPGTLVSRVPILQNN